MSKPNINVIIALFETYLDIRKADWNLEELQNGTVRLPDPTSWEGKKVAACNQSLQLIFQLNPKAKKIDLKEWIPLVDELYDLEEKQRAQFKAQWTGKTHALQDVIAAIRNYIINCLSTEESFKKYFAELKNLQKKHEGDVMRLKNYTEGHLPNELVESEIELAKTNKAIKAVTLDSDYLNDYFVDQVTKLDPKRDNVKNPNVAAFIKDAAEGNRPGILCRKLIESMKKVMQAPAVVHPEAHAEGAADALEGHNPEATPAPKTSSKETPAAPKASKSKKSALMTHSQFGTSSELSSDAAPSNGYNTRSKASLN